MGSEIKYPVVVVHGAGRGDAKTRIGYSTKLRDLVLEGFGQDEREGAWLEAPWEGVNDNLDAAIRKILQGICDVDQPLLPFRSHLPTPPPRHGLLSGRGQRSPEAPEVLRGALDPFTSHTAYWTDETVAKTIRDSCCESIYHLAPEEIEIVEGTTP